MYPFFSDAYQMQHTRNMVAFLCDHYCARDEKGRKKIVTCNISVIKRRRIHTQARDPCHLFLMDQWFYSWINIGYVLDAGKNTPLSIEKRPSRFCFLCHSYAVKAGTNETDILFQEFVCFDVVFVLSYNFLVV